MRTAESRRHGKESQHRFHLLIQAPGDQIERTDSGKFQEIVEQAFQSRTLVVHDIDLVASAAFPRRFGFRQILGQQIHIHADHSQRVLDFVGQRPSQFGQFVVA